MKKVLFVFLTGLIFLSCNQKNNQQLKNQSKQIVKENDDSLEITGLQVVNGIELTKEGYKVCPGKIEKRNPIEIDITKFAGKQVYIELSCNIKAKNKSDSKTQVNWFVDELSENLPSVANDIIPNNKWTKLNGKLTVNIDSGKNIILSGGGYDKDKVTFFISDLSIKIKDLANGEKLEDLTGWYEAPSLKDAYKNYFDYFGLTVTYQGEFDRTEVQKGLMRHADCITFGNELKPDFIFDWQPINKLKEFVAEDGKSYKVPDGIPTYNRVDKILTIARDCNLMVRGHVLVWHSQTPDMFFHEDYDVTKPFVDKATMNARMEWYIKDLLSYINNWEKTKNNGKRIIFAWDVVNEAISDNATDLAYLRDSNSNWYTVYQDDSFIVNAFRYANKYAPKDVLLIYNDYNSYQPAKTKAILKIVDKIQSTKDARIDAVGMQSHIKIDYPAINLYEDAIKQFVAKGLDVQITELDVANGKTVYNPLELKERYKQVFELYLRNRKTSSKHGVSGVTIWGLTDETTWLNALGDYRGYRQYPLLFKDIKSGNFACKTCFDGVLEAAKEAK